MIDFLAGRRLRLHEERSILRPVRAGVTFAGFRIRPHHRYLRKVNIRQFRRRVRGMKKAYAAGKISQAAIQAQIAAWLGHASQADSAGLIERLSKEWVFQRPPRGT